MRRFLQLFFIIGIIAITNTALAQTLTLARDAGSDAATTLVGGSTGNVLLGFSVVKSGSATDFTGVNFTTSSDPATVFGATTNLKMYHNSSMGFGGASTIAGSFSWTTTTITFTPTTNLFSWGGGGSTEYFYITADVLSTVPTTAAGVPTIDLSFDQTQVTFTSSPTVNPFGITGKTFDFQALTASLTQQSGGVSNALVAADAQKAILGFNFTSTGSQNITGATFTLSANAGTIGLTNLELFESNTASYTGTGTAIATVGNAKLSVAGAVVTVTGITATTSKYYFLRTDVSGGASATTFDVELTSATVSAGSIGGSAPYFSHTGISLAALTGTLAQQSGGVSNSLVGGDTQKALIGFNLTSGGTQNVTGAVFTLSATAASLGLTNIELFESAAATYSGTGTAIATVGNGKLSVSGATITVSGVTAATSNYYFIRADISSSASTATFDIGFTSATVDNGTITTSAPFFSHTGISLTALSGSIAQQSGGVSNTLGAGDTQKAIIGFNLTSNGSQTITGAVFTLSATAATIGLTNIELFESNTASYTGVGVVVASTGNGKLAVAGGTVTISGVSATTSKYYFLRANVQSSATPTTFDVQFTSATPSAGTISTAAPFFSHTGIVISYSQTSSITANFTGQNSIDFSEYDMHGSGLTSGGSQRLFSFDVTDQDADNQNTTITGVTLQFSAAALTNLDYVALFIGGTKVTGTEVSASAALDGSFRITYTGISIGVTDPADGATASAATTTVDVRVTFLNAVSDGDLIPVSVFSATASASGSGLAPLGSVTTAGGKNPINVVATRLIYIDPTFTPAAGSPQPVYTGPINKNPGSGNTFSVTVWATDDNNNPDVGQTSNITLTLSGGSGTLGGTASHVLVGGEYTYTGLWVNLAGNYALNASGGGLVATSSGASTAMVVKIASLGVSITNSSGGAINNLNLCIGGTYMPCDFKITESDPADFSTGGIFMLQLPSGFEFDTSSPGTIGFSSSGSEVTVAASNPVSFIGKDIVRLTYAVSGTSVLNSLTVTNLPIKYVGTATTTGKLQPLDAGAQQVGNTEALAKSHCNLTTFPASNAGYDFDVFAFPGQPAIQKAEKIFSYLISGIILRPSVANPTNNAATFSGNGVSFSSAQNAYVFSPASVGFGSFDVVMTTTNGSCNVSVTKTFNVYASSINGLQPEYCINDSIPRSLSVDPLRYDYSLYYTAWSSSTSYSNYSYVSYGGDAYYYYNGLSVPSVIGVTPNTAASGWNKFGYKLDNNDFDIQIYPTYRYITAVTAAAATVTLTSNNHGFQNGYVVQMYAYVYDAVGNFLFYVPYNNYTISNVTTNTFDITYASGYVGSYSTAYGYALINATVTNATNNGGSITITAPNHGLQNSVKVHVTLGGLSDNGITTRIDNWYAVSNVTQNTFDITTTAVGVWDGTGSVDIYNYRVSTFIPKSVNKLNSNFGQVTDFYVNFYVHDANGCVPSVSNTCIPYIFSGDPVHLNQLTVLDFTGLASSLFCSNATSVTLTGNQADGSFMGNGITDGGANNNTASFDPQSGSITQGVQFPITYSFTDSKNCASTITKNVTVNTQPGAPTPSKLQFGYCEKDTQPLVMDVSGTGDEFFWYDNTSTFLAKGTIFDARVAAVNTNSPQTVSFFATQLLGGCESAKVKVDLVINPLPSAAFTNTGQCAFQPIQFAGPSGSIASWAWDFGDGATGTGQNASHTYTDSKNYFINLAVTSTTLVGGAVCKNSKSTPLFIGFSPTMNFNFKKICIGENTQFTHVSSPPLDTLAWDFGDGLQIRGKASATITGYPNTSGTYASPIHKYAGVGTNPVSLIGQTTIGCSDTLVRNVPILIKLTPTATNPYLMKTANNPSEDGYWQVETTNDSTSTWAFAVPSNLNAAAVNAYWTTGAYKSSDLSYVNSPCFDLTGYTRPLISLQYLNDTQLGRDGALLEYSEDSGLTWTTLGTPTSGLNWYNKLPVNALGNAFGWSMNGDVAGTKSFHSLSGIPQANRANVRFRIRFASDQDTEGQGFAFSNVNIVEKNRLVLVENFTNSSKPETVNHDNVFNNLSTNISPFDFVPLEYHIVPAGFEVDPINDLNRADNNARAAFYGLTQSISGTQDGLLVGKFNKGQTAAIDPDFQDNFQLRSLVAADLSLKIQTTLSSANTLNVKVNATALNDVTSTNPIAIYVVLAEKIINNPLLAGANGETQFHYVMRKMLPSASGTPLTLPLAKGDSMVISQPIQIEEGMFSDINQMIIIAFVQDQSSDLTGRKPVWQSSMLLTPTLPALITGTTDPVSSLVKLYPIPAADKLLVEVPASINAKSVKMIDINGHEVGFANFKPSEKVKTLNTGDLANGVYLIEVQLEKTMVRRKVVVVH